MDRAVEVSVVVPAYRAARIVGATIRRLHAVLTERRETAEILIVDDGSADGTGDVARGAAADLGLADDHGPVRFRLLTLPRNRGKGRAVREGMAAAHGRLCVFTDADLAFGTEGFLGVLDALREGQPVAVASRFVKGATVLVPSEQVSILLRRHLASRLLNLAARIGFGVRARDTQAGLKGFSRPVVDAVFPALRTNRFGFDTEIFALTARAGIRPAEVPVRYRFGGKTTSVSLLRDGAITLWDLLAVRLRLWTGGYREAVRALQDVAAAQTVDAQDQR